VGLGRGLTTSLGGALSAGGVLATAMVVPVGVVEAVPSRGISGGRPLGVAQCCRSAGEIMPAPITTDRATSFRGERPW
jgi:hypothetical protein